MPGGSVIQVLGIGGLARPSLSMLIEGTINIHTCIDEGEKEEQTCSCWYLSVGNRACVAEGSVGPVSRDRSLHCTYSTAMHPMLSTAASLFRVGLPAQVVAPL